MAPGENNARETSSAAATGSKLYGLVGRTLGHSWSAQIHAAFGCPGYQMVELEPDELAAFFSRADLGGVNVTIPYKRDVMPLLDGIDAQAREIGCVNTVVRGRDGRLVGYNADIDGFVYMARRLHKRSGVSFAGRKVIVLGSGGASLTACYAARSLGARDVVVISRGGRDNYENLGQHADAGIIVNATPVGMFPNNLQAPLSLEEFPQLEAVIDVIYNPLRTSLLLQAEELGVPATDGLPMLVEQARRADELFFGEEIPIERTEEVLSGLARQLANIVIVGMPGSGKSSVGSAIARIDGREHVDLDALIAQHAGMSIEDIFAAEGEEGFRRREHDEVVAAGRLSGKVITTGGGVVKDGGNYAPLRQNGRIYRVDRNVDELAMDGRPLSAGRERLAQMLEERGPLYERFACATISNEGTIDEAAHAVLHDFRIHPLD